MRNPKLTHVNIGLREILKGLGMFSFLTLDENVGVVVAFQSRRPRVSFGTWFSLLTRGSWASTRIVISPKVKMEV